VTATRGGNTRFIPVASALPLTFKPSESTNTPRRSGRFSLPASISPARSELPSGPMGASAYSTLTALKRATATTRESSSTRTPWISPAVEHPTKTARGSVARNASNAAQASTPSRDAPNTKATVLSESSSPRSGRDHPSAGSNV